MSLEKPVLEIGCGDGGIGRLLFDRIDLAVDINLRAVARARKIMAKPIRIFA